MNTAVEVCDLGKTKKLFFDKASKKKMLSNMLLSG